MHKRLLSAFALCALLTFAVGTVAGAATFKSKVGHLIITVGGSVSPKAMPKSDYVPVTTNIFGEIETDDGSHPSALREVIVDIDKDTKQNPKGYPACKAGQLEAQNTAAAKRVCGKATLGTGIAHAQISFPEQPSIKVTSPITVFNGGGTSAKTKLLIHTFLTVPVPAAIVTQVTIQRKGTGVHSIAKIPRIAGGSGSVLDFDFKLGKTFAHNGKKVGYFEAKCPDGKFLVKSPKILFKNEANTPEQPSQTVLKGSVGVPCTPKG
jgi:hypothetical protein